MNTMTRMNAATYPWSENGTLARDLRMIYGMEELASPLRRAPLPKTAGLQAGGKFAQRSLRFKRSA